MLIFSILAAAWAVYYGVTFDISTRTEGAAALPDILRFVLQLLPIAVSGGVQYWSLSQAGAAGSRLWLPVIGTAIGAPIAGGFLMLIAAFALFGKSS